MSSGSNSDTTEAPATGPFPIFELLQEAFIPVQAYDAQQNQGTAAPNEGAFQAVGTGDGDNMVNVPFLTFGNLSTVIGNFVENATQSPETRRKKASISAMKHLKTMNYNDLKECDRTCPICYEPYDNESIGSPKKDGENVFNTIEQKKKARLQPIDSDPAAWFPTDSTGKGHSEYLKFRPATTSPDEQHVPVQMPCEHIFGKSCLFEWLKSNATCPLCRKEIESEPLRNAPGNNTNYTSSRNRVLIPSDWGESSNAVDDPCVPIPAPQVIGISRIPPIP